VGILPHREAKRKTETRNARREGRGRRASRAVSKLSHFTFHVLRFTSYFLVQCQYSFYHPIQVEFGGHAGAGGYAHPVAGLGAEEQ